MLKFAISYWIIQLSFLSVHAQDLCMPAGWATENGGTTGGGSASPIVVSTLADLQSQASSSGSKVIYVSREMGTGEDTRVSVSSDKTIFGLPGAKLNGGIDIKDVSNVIVRNLIISGPGAVDVNGVDCILIQNSSNVWIDHCDISDGQDGNLDIVNGSNYISVTWTKFHYTNASVEHKFSNLIGNSDSKTSDRGKLKVTMMFNYWTESCVERMPRVRFGQVHVVNNLFDSPDAKQCVRAGVEADLRVEANVFKGVDKPIDLYQDNFTAVTELNNIFTNTSGNTSGNGNAFIPPYTLSVLPANQVEEVVLPCVGATLTTADVCPCSETLPVSLIYFTVKQLENTWQLRWMLTEDEKLKEIHIEYSLDGIHFETIQAVDRYAEEYTLIKPVAAVSYVRLKFIEDEYISYSPVKVLYPSESIQVYPNPFSDCIHLSAAGTKTIVVYALTGKMIMAQNLSNSTILQTENLEKGMYLFCIKNNFTGEEEKKILMRKE